MGQSLLCQIGQDITTEKLVTNTKAHLLLCCPPLSESRTEILETVQRDATVTTSPCSWDFSAPPRMIICHPQKFWLSLLLWLDASLLWMGACPPPSSPSLKIASNCRKVKKLRHPTVGPLNPGSHLWHANPWLHVVLRGSYWKYCVNIPNC